MIINSLITSWHHIETSNLLLSGSTWWEIERV